VGAIVSLTVVAAIDDPTRFKSSRSVGAHFGLTQEKYQSWETDITGRISRCGDDEVRTALYEAAKCDPHPVCQSVRIEDLGMAIAERAGMRKAKVALARKLSVIQRLSSASNSR
jgi:transposase